MQKNNLALRYFFIIHYIYYIYYIFETGMRARNNFSSLSNADTLRSCMLVGFFSPPVVCLLFGYPFQGLVLSFQQ